MTATNSDVDRSRGPNGRSAVTVFFVSCFGTALEYYDYLIYGLASALILGDLFFPTRDPAMSTLIAISTFGAGFLVRPLGGLFVGHFGDRIGRRRMLILTLILMGCATLGVGLLPTYTSIGLWAPILLVTLRLVQGFAVGGEWGGAALFGVESAPAHRRGLWGSFTSMGHGVGSVMAAGMFVLVTLLFSDGQFAEWAWRIPFLFGALLVVLGVAIRIKTTEDTPAFEQAKAHGVASRLPAVEVLTSHLKPVLLITSLAAGYSAVGFVSFTFFLSYATEEAGFAQGIALTAQMFASTALLLTAPLFASISDRIGRRPVTAAGAVAMSVFLFFYFPMVDAGNLGLLYLAFVMGHVFLAAMTGPMPAFIGEQFDVRIRYSGSSIGLQLGSALGGGTAPTLAALIYAWSDGTSGAVAVFGALAMGIVLVAVALLPETAKIPTAELNTRHVDSAHVLR